MNFLFIPFFIATLTLCTPYDDARFALIQVLQSTKSECLVAVYTINSPVLVNTLIDLERRGVNVRLITDSTQASGRHETEALHYLQAAGVKVYVGKSVDHQIMHTKYCVIDDQTVAFGSFNWTDVANKQDNTLTIETDPKLADQLRNYWFQIWKDLK
jgi:phosphatidylserine/phosphatidylglycerophosphate/cardiolipin synthase-like enzyme